MSQKRARSVVQAVITACLALCILAASAAYAEWLEVGSTPFSRGRGQVVVSTDAGFYVFSQWQASTVQNAVFYSVGGDATIRDHYCPTPAPYSFETGTAAAWDGSRYIYFLVGAKYSEGRRNVIRYDTESRDWCSSGLPDTRYAQGAGNSLAYVKESHGSYIYAVVGVAVSQSTSRPSEDRLSAFMRLQVEPFVGASWETIEVFGFCVDDGSALTLAGEHLYFMHGCDCNDNPVTTFWRFSICTQEWEEPLAAIPASVGANDGASLAWDGSRYLYATVGGANESKQGRRARGDEFFRFDLVTETWEELSPLPGLLGDAPGNRLAIIDGHLYLWVGSVSGNGIFSTKLDN